MGSDLKYYDAAAYGYRSPYAAAPHGSVRQRLMAATEDGAREKIRSELRRLRGSFEIVEAFASEVKS